MISLSQDELLNLLMENKYHRFVKDGFVLRLCNVDLRKNDLKNLDFTAVELYHCNLRGANLSETCLTITVFDNCDMRHCNMRGANFNGSSLRGSNLSYSDIGGAVFYAADIQGTNFKAVKNGQYATVKCCEGTPFVRIS